jgi:hypothetical protein
MGFSKDELEVGADSGHAPEGMERLYEQYRIARDNGQGHLQIRAEGWCGDLIDILGDRYYQEQKQYEREMEDRRPPDFRAQRDGRYW